VIAASLASSCAALPPEPVPAVLAGEEARREALAIVAGALGDRSYSVGGDEGLERPVLSLVPPQPHPLEGRSLIKPRIFDISADAEACYLRERGDGSVSISIPRQLCRAL
jgi:hypothetical protein